MPPPRPQVHFQFICDAFCQLHPLSDLGIIVFSVQLVNIVVFWRIFYLSRLFLTNTLSPTKTYSTKKAPNFPSNVETQPNYDIFPFSTFQFLSRACFACRRGRWRACSATSGTAPPWRTAGGRSWSQTAHTTRPTTPVLA